jgi:hypothetical protein
MREQRRTGLGLNRVLALMLVVLSVFVLAHFLSHSHRDGQTEAGCQVCQAAHARSLPSGEVRSTAVPLVTVGYVQPLVANFLESFLPRYYSSRAPPVA